MGENEFYCSSKQYRAGMHHGYYCGIKWNKPSIILIFKDEVGRWRERIIYKYFQLRCHCARKEGVDR